VRVNCFKNEGYCRLDELDVQPPSEENFVYDFTVFWPDAVYYKITRWSADVVQAEYQPPMGSSCRSTTMDLNFNTKEFYLITKNTSQDCEVFGLKMEPLKKPRISEIVDGKKIIADERQAFSQKTYDMLSSEFRSRLEKYRKTTP
jgi:hypothetical protein